MESWKGLFLSYITIFDWKSECSRLMIHTKQFFFSLCICFFDGSLIATLSFINTMLQFIFTLLSVLVCSWFVQQFFFCVHASKWKKKQEREKRVWHRASTVNYCIHNDNIHIQSYVGHVASREKNSDHFFFVLLFFFCSSLSSSSVYAFVYEAACQIHDCLGSTLTVLFLFRENKKLLTHNQLICNQRKKQQKKKQQIWSLFF